MKIIFGILFAVFAGLAGAYAAGPIGDWLLLQENIEAIRPTFDSPDQAAYFDLVVRLSITLAFAFVGMIVGILFAAAVRGRLIRQEH
jgi:hypothetical protein